jgi:hypothetical protein
LPPVVLVFAAMVLVLTQLFHVVFPGRISYLRRIIVSICGVVFGEALAGRILPGGPRMGELHPLWDVGFTTALQLLGNRFLGESSR